MELLKGGLHAAIRTLWKGLIKMDKELLTLQKELQNDMLLLRKASELEGELSRLKGFEAEIPILIDKARDKCREAEEDISAVEEKIQGLKKELRDKEGAVSDLKGHIIQRRSKLTDVKTNKEYQALLSEMELLEKKIGKNEERQLSIMEELDGLGVALKAKKKDFDVEKQKFEEVKKQKELEKTRLKEAIKEESAKKDEIFSQINPKLALQYERLVTTGKRDAVVAYKSQACQSCYARTTPQEEVMMRRGNVIVICPHCSRFLYWGE